LTKPQQHNITVRIELLFKIVINMLMVIYDIIDGSSIKNHYSNVLQFSF